MTRWSNPSGPLKRNGAVVAISAMQVSPISATKQLSKRRSVRLNRNGLDEVGKHFAVGDAMRFGGG